MYNSCFFHHFSQIVDMSSLRYAYRTGGYISVTIFFLIAGYVTCKKFQSMKKELYKSFFVNKIFRLYLPIMIISIGFNNFMDGLLFMYIVTWGAYRFVNKKFIPITVLLGNIAFIVLCIVLNCGEWWYNDILPYSIGFYLCFYLNEIIEFMEKRWLALISVVGVCWIVTWFMAQKYQVYVLTSSINSIFTAFLGR